MATDSLRRGTEGKAKKRKSASWYPMEPQVVDASTWFYIEPKGVCIVRQIREGAVLKQGDIFYLPWTAILKAAKKKQAMGRRRK